MTSLQEIEGKYLQILEAIDQALESLPMPDKIPEITSTEEAQRQSSLRVQINQKYKNIDAYKKKVTAPLRVKITEINSAFQSRLEVVEEIKTQLDRNILKYHKKIQEEKEAEAKKVEEQASNLSGKIEKLSTEIGALKQAQKATTGKAGKEKLQQLIDEKEGEIMKIEKDGDSLLPVQEKETKTVVDGGSVSIRHRWSFELLDISKVPDTLEHEGTTYELKTINSTEVKKLISSTGGNIHIPGIKAVQQEQVASRSPRKT